MWMMSLLIFYIPVCVYITIFIYLVVREDFYYDMTACDRVPWQWTYSNILDWLRRISQLAYVSGDVLEDWRKTVIVPLCSTIR